MNSPPEFPSMSLVPRFSESIVYPPTPPLEESDRKSIGEYVACSLSGVTTPRDILGCTNVSASYTLATPPLTPDDDICSSLSHGTGNDALQSKHSLDFLLTIFPHDGPAALPFAKSVNISAANLGATFDGVVLELPGKPKALYVDGKSAPSVSLRESIVALLDLADECFNCGALVIALDRSSPALGDILHSFLYVGGNVVTKPPFQVDPMYLLVGMDI